MIVLTIRTDKPEAEIGLFVGKTKLAYEKWQAHRQLSETIHTKIHEMLSSLEKDWNNLEAVAFFKGPGSFTGLRIGVTVANTLASELDIPIVGTTGEDWIQTGLTSLGQGKTDKLVEPDYGRDPHITIPKG